MAQEPPRDLTGRIKVVGVNYISAGGFSTVWIGCWAHPAYGPPNQKLAIKAFLGSQLLQYAEAFERRLRRETMNWQLLRHRNILPLLGICYEKIGYIPDYPALISPYCQEGNINDFLRKNPYADKAAFIHQAAEGLSYLHTRGFIHGDLKGSNILISDHGEACLCDFGRSRLASDNDYTKTLLASAQFAAPELLLHSAENDPIPVSFESDIWAFAMVIVEILTGGKPWPGYIDLVVLQRIPWQREKPDRRKYPLINDHFWNALWPCWTFEPRHRPTIRDLKTRLPLSL